MAVSDTFTAFVVDQLDGCGAIVTKRMFGGVGVYAGDLFFALLDNDVLYLKVGDSNRGDFESMGMGPFRPYGDGGETMQYYEVPVAVLEDAGELERWARKAIRVAEAKRSAKRKLPRSRKAAPRTRRATKQRDKPKQKKARGKKL